MSTFFESKRRNILVQDLIFCDVKKLINKFIKEFWVNVNKLYASQNNLTPPQATLHMIEKFFIYGLPVLFFRIPTYLLVFSITLIILNYKHLNLKYEFGCDLTCEVHNMELHLIWPN
jgi:hypothetical protein